MAEPGQGSLAPKHAFLHYTISACLGWFQALYSGNLNMHTGWVTAAKLLQKQSIYSSDQDTSNSVNV